MQPVSIGGKAAHGRGVGKTTGGVLGMIIPSRADVIDARAVAIIIGLLVADGGAPWKPASVQSAASGFFPFRFGGQAIAVGRSADGGRDVAVAQDGVTHRVDGSQTFLLAACVAIFHGIPPVHGVHRVMIALAFAGS